MMKRMRKALLFAGCLFLIITSVGCATKGTTPNSKATSAVSATANPIPTQATKTVKLTVSAAASLTDSLNEIKKLYETENPKTEIIYNFGASGALQNQIEQGAVVDLFISASKKQIEALKAKGMIAEDTVKNLLGNKLVLVAPKDSKLSIDFNGLTKDDVKKIGVGESKSVPAGQYAEEVFTKLEILEKIKPKEIFAKDVKEIVTWAETGNIDAGIVYESEAKASTKLKLLAYAPEGSHAPIIYPLVIIKDSKNMEATKGFVQYLSTEKAKDIFIKNGYSIIEK